MCFLTQRKIRKCDVIRQDGGLKNVLQSFYSLKVLLKILKSCWSMALVKRDCQASVALVQQKNVEKDKKSNVKVLDEETYVQV